MTKTELPLFSTYAFKLAPLYPLIFHCCHFLTVIRMWLSAEKKSHFKYFWNLDSSRCL
jgi:hypothetical protein